MRVALAIGRTDPLFDPHQPAASGDSPRPDAYWTSSILRDLQIACPRRGWACDIFYIGQTADQRVARPQVVVNLISEPLICTTSLALLGQHAQRFGLRVLNTPTATVRTSRINLPTLAGAVPDTVIPLTTWHRGPASDLETHIRAAHGGRPVLMRPPGSHGSKGLSKVDLAHDALARFEPAPGGYLVTDFVDFRSADGLYRKYRMIRIGRQLFHRHLITADDWNITGASRTFMVGRPALIEAEKEFLAGGGGDLEPRISALFEASGLDFGLIDFAVDRSGRIIVFELNGCFQITRSIPPDKIARWGHLEAGNGPILEALLDLIAARAV